MGYVIYSIYMDPKKIWGLSNPYLSASSHDLIGLIYSRTNLLYVKGNDAFYFPLKWKWYILWLNFRFLEI